MPDTYQTPSSGHTGNASREDHVCVSLYNEELKIEGAGWMIFLDGTGFLHRWSKAEYFSGNMWRASGRSRTESSEVSTFRMIIENAPLGVVVVGENGTVVFCSETAEAIFSSLGRKLTGAKISSILPGAHYRILGRRATHLHHSACRRPAILQRGV